MKKLLIIFLLGIVSLPGIAQDSTMVITEDTLHWKTIKVIVKADSSVVHIPCEFITRGNRHVDMFIGTLHHQYTVPETEGTWTDLTGNGTIKYFLSEERDRFMVIERNESVLIITVDFTLAGGLSIPYPIETVNPAGSI